MESIKVVGWEQSREVLILMMNSRMLDKIRNSLRLMSQCWEMISILERVLGHQDISITIREAVANKMKKFRDNNFQESSTKESTQIRFNRISNTKIHPKEIQIQLKDQYQIGIITNMPVLKDKGRVVDNLQ
jgi:hypothetical protein